MAPQRTIRLPDDIDTAAERAKGRYKGNRTRLYEMALRSFLDVPEPGKRAARVGVGFRPSDGTRTTESSSAPPDPLSPEEREVDVVTWLSTRTGQPRAICARKLKAGKLSIDGEVTTAQRMTAVTLVAGNVTFDGQKL